MRSIRFAVAAAALIATTAMASPTDPKLGVDYVAIPAPQATPAGKKIEVLEFFGYHCPACNMMEPYVHTLAKRASDTITFRRVPFPFQGELDSQARLYLTLEAMGKVDEFSPRVFRAVHVERQRLTKDEPILEWVAKSGLDKAKFNETWNSFGVMTKLRRLAQVATSYNVSSTPTFIVDGRYQVTFETVARGTPQLAGAQVGDAVIDTIQSLAVRLAKERGAAAAPAAPATPAKPAAKSK